MKYMLDANALRHLAAEERGYENISSHFLDVGISSLVLSAIAAAEIHKAMHNHKPERAERAALGGWLAAMNVVGFDADAAQTAGEMAAKHERKGKTISKPDYMIAGHAIHLDCVMVTDNTKHFTGITGLKVENWLRPK